MICVHLSAFSSAFEGGGDIEILGAGWERNAITLSTLPCPAHHPSPHKPEGAAIADLLLLGMATHSYGTVHPRKISSVEVLGFRAFLQIIIVIQAVVGKDRGPLSSTGFPRTLDYELPKEDSHNLNSYSSPNPIRTLPIPCYKGSYRITTYLWGYSNLPCHTPYFSLFSKLPFRVAREYISCLILWTIDSEL